MDKTVKLELTIEQLNVVMGGLVKLPIELGLTTFNVIQQQADTQLKRQAPEGPLSDKVLN